MNNSTAAYMGCEAPKNSTGIKALRFWLQCILPLIIGLMGFIGNSISIPVLCSKKMNSVFNRILVFLAIFDNVFILCGIFSVIRRNYDDSDHHIFIYAYSLYQISAISIVCSIWTTVMLALERFLTITRPTEYFIATQGTNPWKRVMSYILPVITFSVIFNIPKFFEIQVSEIYDEVAFRPLESNETQIFNVSKLQLSPTKLRMHNDYILYYQNLAKLIVTGILPLVALCYFNLRIYKALRRRSNSGILSGGTQSSEDSRNAVLLFGIVLIFLLTNVTRIFINLYELIHIGSILRYLSLGCDPIPLWLHISADTSELLLVLNSSINFFLYCMMSAGFRRVLSDVFSRLVDFSAKKIRVLLRGQGSTEVNIRLAPNHNNNNNNHNTNHNHPALRPTQIQEKASQTQGPMITQL